MRKIRFGSFPLVEIPKKDRRCLDKYLIKSFSDNISISDAMRNLSITKDLLYITPDALMRSWLQDSSASSSNMGSYHPNRHEQDRQSDDYNAALKRAFYILKEFYKNVSNKPFYHEYIYYPIYIEKVENLPIRSGRKDYVDIKDVTMNYSFIILSNDLDSDLHIDEIRYDENATLNFLYLFSEFFSNPLKRDNKATLNDLKPSDLNFIIKFYQFVEKTNKTPIEITLDLYKFIGIIDKLAGSMRHPSLKEIEKEISRYFDKETDISEFKKYSPIMKSAFIKEFKNISTTTDMEKYRAAFKKMLETLFEQKGFIDLFGDIKDTDSAFRKTVVYNSNKYQEIISLAEELVKFNKVQDTRSIVVEDQIDFNFKIEQGGYALDFQSQVVSQKYQEYFKEFIGQLKVYITEKISKNFTLHLTQASEQAEDEFGRTLKEIKKYRDIELNELNALKEEFKKVDEDWKKVDTKLSAMTPGTHEFELWYDKRDKLALEKNQLQTEIATTRANYNTYVAEIARLEALTKTVNTSFTRTLKSDFLQKMSAEIMQNMTTDIAFLYDDLKDLFLSEELVKQQLANPIENTADFDRILGSPNSGERYLKELYETLDADLETLAESMYNSMKDAFIIYENELTKEAEDFVDKGKDTLSRSIRTGFIKYFTDPSNKNSFVETYKKELKDRMIGTVIKRINRVFEKKRYKKEIELDKRLSELHPLIKKLLKNPQNFRSFIVDFDTLENLYNLWFITQTKKFTAGLIPQLPRKLSNPKNRIEFTLENMLGLYSNPVWIISKTKIYLSMPDYLSLTKSKILSSIPKEELSKICKIDAKDYWDENKLGKSAQISGKTDTSKEQGVVDEKNDKVKELEILYNGEKDVAKKAKIKIKLDKAKRELAKAKNDLEKAKKKKTTNKDMPNLFDTWDSSNSEIMTPEEQRDLMKHKSDLIPGAVTPTNKPFEDAMAEKVEQDLESVFKEAEKDLNKDLEAIKKQKEIGDQPHFKKDPKDQYDQFDDIFARRDRRDI